MTTVSEIIQQVIRHSGRPTRRFYLGIALRLLERAFSIAPFFVAFVWFSQTLGADATLTNSVVAQGSPKSHLTWLFVLLLILLCQLLFSYFGQLQSFVGAYVLTRGYREQLINHVGCLPLGQLQQQSTGRLASILTDDVNRVEKIFTHLVADLSAAVIVPLVFLLPLLWMNWQLALSVFITLPVAFVLLNAMRHGFLKRSKRKQEQMLDVSGLLVEFVTGIKTLRLFNQAAKWINKLDWHFNEIRKSSFHAEAWGGGPVQLFRFTLELGLVLMLLVGAWLAHNDMLSSLHWLFFVMLVYKLIDPLMEAAAFLVELRAMAQSGERIDSVLAEPPLPTVDGPHTVADYGVKFDRVGFRYKDEWVLKDISVEIPAGSVTAIVGPSGSGKSSLLNLLARFYDPQQGRVLLGGVDLRHFAADELYAYLGFVFQDVQLFNGSVLENVRVGKANASDDAVIVACKAAWCDDFVMQLPEGYQTRIGENGQSLSGGERQRLSIARAILRDAPVLLLDEATASVDPDTQFEIQQALSQLIKNRTVIVIAHRLHTIQFAEQILVLDQGQIIAYGKHDELLRQGGLYSDMWYQQSGDLCCEQIRE